MVNGKQHSVWFIRSGMNGLPQNVLLNFRLEFPKSDLTIYLPSGISEIFCQMVSNPVLVLCSSMDTRHLIFVIIERMKRVWQPRSEIRANRQNTGARI